MRVCSQGGICGCFGGCMCGFIQGGMHGFIWGVCMVLFGVCMVLFGGCGFIWGACMVALGGACVVLFGGDMCGFIRGACMVLFRGGVHGFFSFFGYNEIRSMSGRYASYWNAFLLVLLSMKSLVSRSWRKYIICGTIIYLYFFPNRLNEIVFTAHRRSFGGGG